jgi:hypothetical protein
MTGQFGAQPRAQALSDEVDTGSAKESVLKQKPRDAGLMQWGRIRL